LNRRGERIDTVGPPDTYDQPALSPDGTQLAVSVISLAESKVRVWLWDLARNLGRPFSALPDQDTQYPLWTADGSRILYLSGPEKLVVQSVDRSSIDSIYTSQEEGVIPSAWSADGEWILFASYSRDQPENHYDIVAFPSSGRQRPLPIVATRAWEVQPALTQDGKWLAYASSESGHFEIYAQSFLGRGEKWRISTEGGVQPSWRGDGRELYYLANDGGLMSVTVEPGPTPRFSVPHQLFKAPSITKFNTRNQYAATRDGQRFLFVASEGKDTAGTTKVVLNWPALLTKR
jgi:Tol biopolymer transport system component